MSVSLLFWIMVWAVVAGAFTGLAALIGGIFGAVVMAACILLYTYSCL